MPDPIKAMQEIAAAALAGAEAELRKQVSFDQGVEPIVVVNVAWSVEGRHFAVGSTIPDGHGNELLAESLKQSAEEAEDSF